MAFSFKIEPASVRSDQEMYWNQWYLHEDARTTRKLSTFVSTRPLLRLQLGVQTTVKGDLMTLTPSGSTSHALLEHFMSNQARDALRAGSHGPSFPAVAQALAATDENAHLSYEDIMFRELTEAASALDSREALEMHQQDRLTIQSRENLRKLNIVRFVGSSLAFPRAVHVIVMLT